MALIRIDFLWLFIYWFSEKKSANRGRVNFFRKKVFRYWQIFWAACFIVVLVAKSESGKGMVNFFLEHLERGKEACCM